MPFSAPLPVPTVIESSVASPGAQGHAMISTETALTSAWSEELAHQEANAEPIAHTMGRSSHLIRHDEADAPKESQPVSRTSSNSTRLVLAEHRKPCCWECNDLC